MNNFDFEKGSWNVSPRLYTIHCWKEVYAIQEMSFARIVYFPPLPPPAPPTWNALLTILTPDTLLPHNSGRAITWIIFKIVKIIFYLRSYVGIIIQDWKLKYFRNYQLFFYTISTYVHLIRIYVQLLYILNKLELTKLHL